VYQTRLSGPEVLSYACDTHLAEVLAGINQPTTVERMHDIPMPKHVSSLEELASELVRLENKVNGGLQELRSEINIVENTMNAIRHAMDKTWP